MMVIGTLSECRYYLTRLKRTHPAAPLITNLVEASKKYPRATDEQRKEIAKYMEKMMQGIETFGRGA